MKGSYVSTWLVRKGEHDSWSAAGESSTIGKGEPDLYGHVVKMGGRQVWKVTVGKRGQVLAHGASWFRWRAKLRARAVAQRPDILRDVRLLTAPYMCPKCRVGGYRHAPWCTRETTARGAR